MVSWWNEFENNFALSLEMETNEEVLTNEKSVETLYVEQADGNQKKPVEKPMMDRRGDPKSEKTKC